MSILNSSKLSEDQRAWMQDNYNRTVAKAKAESTGQTEKLSWFLRLTFTLTWVGLLTQFCMSEGSIVIERMTALGVWWVMGIETVSASIATIGLVVIFFIKVALEKENDYKTRIIGSNNLCSGLLVIEKRITFGSFVSWANNIMLIITLAICGWTSAAAWMAILTFSVVCYIMGMKTMALNYYSELSSERIEYLRNNSGEDENGLSEME